MGSDKNFSEMTLHKHSDKDSMNNQGQARDQYDVRDYPLDDHDARGGVLAGDVGGESQESLSGANDEHINSDPPSKYAEGVWKGNMVPVQGYTEEISNDVVKTAEREPEGDEENVERRPTTTATPGSSRDVRDVRKPTHAPRANGWGLREVSRVPENSSNSSNSVVMNREGTLAGEDVREESNTTRVPRENWREQEKVSKVPRNRSGHQANRREFQGVGESRRERNPPEDESEPPECGESRREEEVPPVDGRELPESGGQESEASIESKSPLTPRAKRPGSYEVISVPVQSCGVKLITVTKEPGQQSSREISDEELEEEEGRKEEKGKTLCSLVHKSNTTINNKNTVSLTDTEKTTNRILKVRQKSEAVRQYRRRRKRKKEKQQQARTDKRAENVIELRRVRKKVKKKILKPQHFSEFTQEIMAEKNPNPNKKI